MNARSNPDPPHPDRPPDAWTSGESYEQYVGRWSERVARRFIDWLNVPAGRDWIDVGCGTGAVTRSIVATRDPRRVVAVDLSDAFLEHARARVEDGRVSFQTGNAVDLPFDAGQMYGLTFSAPKHRPAWQMLRRVDFIRSRDQVEADDVVLRLMLVPDSPGTSDVAGAFERLVRLASPFAASGTGIDVAGFGRLAVPAQMAMLNIEAKLRETIVDGLPLLSFVRL